MSRMVTTSGVGDHWGPTDPQTIQAIANVLSYHPEIDGKTLLKRQHLHKSHNVKKPIGKNIWKFLLRWLAFTVLGGTVYASKGGVIINLIWL